MILTSFLLIKSVIWNIRISRWRVFFAELNFPFFANLIVLVLSLKTTLKLTLNPWSSVNLLYYATLIIFFINGNQLWLYRTCLAQLFLVELDDMVPKPILSAPPVWLFTSGCIPSPASMYQWKFWLTLIWSAIFIKMTFNFWWTLWKSIKVKTKLIF